MPTTNHHPLKAPFRNAILMAPILMTRARIQVTTTTETKADAQAIADALVEKRLAACVQIIGPITSTYRWQGEIERAEEWLCVIKSRRELYDDLEAAILEIHPYDVPEILITPVTGGSES